MTVQKMVNEFHEKFGLAIRETPWSTATMDLRWKLIEEEFQEVADAMDNVEYDPYPGCEADLLKELADLVYVVYGTAVSLGMDLDTAVERVHQSNMSKLGEDGKPIYREDGKCLKGQNYLPPNLEDLV